MKRRHHTLFALLVGLALVATVAGITTRSAHADWNSGGVRCSASRLAPPRAVAGVPAAVARMRMRIAEAARRCDYAELERLGNKRGRGLTFSYGVARSATAYWRRLERTPERPRPMEALVKVLALPFARNEAGFYVWPSAHRARPSERDWNALRTLYPRALIERMKRQGTGYLGYRVGITRAGDWQYFVAGD